MVQRYVSRRISRKCLAGLVLLIAVGVAVFAASSNRPVASDARVGDIVAVAKTGAVSGQLSAGQAPTAEFIAAALRDQLEAAALDVTYEHAFTGYPEKTMAWRYIRTKSFKYKERVDLQEGCRRFSYFNWDTQEARSFSADGEDRTASGKITPVPWDTESYSPVEPEPVLSTLTTGHLADLIGQGTILGQEEIDGHECWKIEVVSTERVGTKYTVWIDPEIGFSPRQIKTIDKWNDEILCTLSSYAELSDGVFVPMSGRWRYTYGDDTIPEHTSELKVKQARSVQTIDVDVSFPPGTAVRDRIRDIEYVVR